MEYRIITPEERALLEAAGCHFEDDAVVETSAPETLKYIRRVRFSGHVRFGRFAASFTLPGGLKKETLQEAMVKHPERVIEHAVKGMLPKNTLGRKQGMKLKVYAGPEHPHAAQKPRQIKIGE